MSHLPNSAEERRRIAVDIFDITGQKVDLDDPVVTAALFYSAKMQQGANEIRKATEEAQRSVTMLAASSIAQATKIESEKIKSKLSHFAEGIKRDVLSAVDTDTSNPDRRRSIFATGVTLFLVACSGVAVGAYCFPAPSVLTPSQTKDLNMARELREVLPHLDNQTREKLISALEGQIKKAKAR